MGKVSTNNRINYFSSQQLILQQGSFVNQPLTLTSSPTFANLQITNDVVINGGLTVLGDSSIFYSDVTAFKDNVLLLNNSQTGGGITLGIAGLQVDRGTLPDYQIIYQESSNTFRVGEIGFTQPLATREDSPLDSGIMTWDSVSSTLLSTNSLQIPIDITSNNTQPALTLYGALKVNCTTDSTFLGQGSAILGGGLSVNNSAVIGGDIYVAGNIDLTNAGGLIHNLNMPVVPTDAASKQYVDMISARLTIKDACKVATVTAGTLSTDFFAGQVIDGYTLVTGDRILIKDQADGIENGIYIVPVSGTPSRSSDYANGDVGGGAFVYIQFGNNNNNVGFVCNNDLVSDTIGTDPLNFTQYSSSGGQITAGAGLVKLFNSISFNPDDVSIEVENMSNIVRIKNTALGTGLTGGSGSVIQVLASQPQITTIGTIGSGTWQGSTIQKQYGGTGTTGFTPSLLFYGELEQSSLLSFDTSGYLSIINDGESFIQVKSGSTSQSGVIVQSEFDPNIFGSIVVEAVSNNFGSGTSVGSFLLFSQNVMQIVAGNSTVMNMFTDGNVQLIGNLTSQAEATFGNVNLGQTTITTSDTSANLVLDTNLIYFNNNTTSWAITGDQSFLQLTNGTGQNKALSITTSGNVCIGTSTSNSLLTVSASSYISTDSTSSNFLGLIGGANTSTASNIIIGNEIAVNSITNTSLNVENVPIVNLTGYLVSLNKNLIINSTENATGYTIGNAFTSLGGGSVAKDFYIGGNLNIAGQFNLDGLLTAPILSFSGTSGISSLSFGNVKLIKLSTEAILSFWVQVVPLVSNSYTSFVFTVPSRTSSFINPMDIISNVNGFTTNEYETLFNTLCVATSGTNALVKFQSNSTSAHTLMINLKYTSD